MIKQNNRIPKPFQKVKFIGRLSGITGNVVECNLGGKCKIRLNIDGKHNTIKNIDVSEIEPA
jgi:hypothetical protein